MVFANSKAANIVISSAVLMLLAVSAHQSVSACSTFKLEKGNKLIYGHNLNQGDIGVPGMIYINKRGVFKKGRTWDELLTTEKSDSSSLYWISKYGSVTFNVFAKDFPDGGINEVGLYIWEMNESADCPKNDNLPRLNKMNWMQFILDSYSTVDEAVRSASEVEIDGRSWHYFVGDARGDCAVIAFINGRVVVNRDQTMPVPGLFNTPYDRELEILKYYKGFGGFYDPDLNDPEVPRFVKTAVMVRDFDPADDAVDYGFEILEKITVYDIPEWSVIVDAVAKNVYFKTRVNPAIKSFCMNDIDFSNSTGCMILDMDKAETGSFFSGTDVLDQFHPYTNEEMRAFVDSFVVPILPEEFFTSGGLTVAGYLDRFSSHADAAASESSQFFSGTWVVDTLSATDRQGPTVQLTADEDAVNGRIFISDGSPEGYPIDHLQLIGNQINFTFGMKNKGWEKTLIEVQGVIEGDTLTLQLFDIEKQLGTFHLVGKL